ncbi:MAG TPA: alpha/beta hydrolase [Caulobacteraceae bacterium]|jgi:pimeloyl-ACP methyl ester carboxylesterase
MSMMRFGQAHATASVAFGLALLALAGCAGGPRPTYEATAQPYPPLFVDCRGTPGPAPTVILEAGAFGTSADWDRVLDDLSRGGRVCAYDRAGLGRSAPSEGGLDVIARAQELGRLIDQIGETRPVILVGHSNGALYIQAFARLQPQRVAGLVYVNGVGVDDLHYPLLMGELTQERRLSRLAADLGKTHLAGLVADTLSEPGLSSEAEEHKRAALTCVPCLETARDEDVLIVAGLKAVAALPDDARQIPTVAIVGSEDPPDWREPRDWAEAEEAPALRASIHWVLYAQGASHVSPLARDRAYVAAAVDWLRSPYRTQP